MSAVAPAAPETTTATILRLDDVAKHYRVGRSRGPFGRPAMLRSVDGVTLELARGETFGLVGESGSGKSTLGRLAVRLERPTHGRVSFDGMDITRLSGDALRRQRARMQVVFQDPLGSLNPRMTVAQTVGEPLAVFEKLRGAALRLRVDALLDAVGLDPTRAGSYPASLSGGQRQRVGIARAIALNPDLILADEAVSALDVSVQAQIVNLFVELRERLGLTYLFIGHGLPVVRQIASRVGVMYLGRLVEVGPAGDVLERPRHPYTKALVNSAPAADPAHRRQRVVLSGEPPSPLDLPSGCRFRTRCPIAQDLCADVAPTPVTVAGGHTVECHFPNN